MITAEVVYEDQSFTNYFDSLSLAADHLDDLAIDLHADNKLSDEEYSDVRHNLRDFIGGSPGDVQDLPWTHECDRVTFKIY